MTESADRIPAATPGGAAQHGETGAPGAGARAAEQEAAQGGHDMSREVTPLEAAYARLIRRMRAVSDARRAYDGVAIEALSAPAFRALVAERLRSLERDVAEIRSRINGLLFVVAGAVLSQLVLRIFT